MDGITNMAMPVTKNGSGEISILDESLITGEGNSYKVYCTADPGFVSIAVVEPAKNKFAGFEGFHFTKLLTEDQLAKKISALQQQSSILKKVEFKNVSVLFGGNRFTFIPSALFKEDEAKDFFYFNQKEEANESLHFDRLRGFDAVNVFSVPDSLHSAFRNLFENFSVHHNLSAVMESARFQSARNSKIPLFIHLHSSAIDIVILNERKLVFANSFSFSATEDAVYFVMMVCEQLELNPEKTDVIISGEIEKDSSLTRQLMKFFPVISFAERTKSVSFTYGFENLPAHFYHAAFSHILCE